MPEYDSKDMARRGRIGGFATAAKHDSRAINEKARATFRESFIAAVDPDGTLPPEERERRAEAARRGHYARLARLSVLRRSRRFPAGPEAA